MNSHSNLGMTVAFKANLLLYKILTIIVGFPYSLFPKTIHIEGSKR